MDENILTSSMKAEYTKVAYYYYISGMTQDEIAKRMRTSRQRINRILKNCVDLGIVKISIEGLEEDNLEVELKLEKKFNLKAACVVKNIDSNKIHEDLGKTAALFLAKAVANGDIIGLSRGRSISELVENLPNVDANNITITQLFGNENSSNSATKADDIVYRASKKLHANHSLLYAPVIVKNKEVKESIVNEPFFKESYETIKKCNIAVVGIGTKDSQIQHVLEFYKGDETVDMSWLDKVVGEVCTYYYDKEGNTIETPFKDRVIAVNLDDYLNIQTRVGVAGQKEKVDAIASAIKGNFINVLVTDLDTAVMLLEKH